MTTFRDSIGATAPPSLQRTWGSRVLHSIGVAFDALMDWAFRGARSSLAANAPPDGLTKIGNERGIMRGFAESAAAYAVRLSTWMLDQKQKGTAIAMLRQLQGYFSGYAVQIRIVNHRGTWHSIDANGAYSYCYNNNWNWDNDLSKHNRFWVIIYPSNVWPIAKTYGANYDYKPAPEAAVWGVEAAPQHGLDILQIINDWNAAHADCWGVILAFDPASFDPTTPSICDGTWGKCYKYDNGIAVPSRLTSARYFERKS